MQDIQNSKFGYWYRSPVCAGMQQATNIYIICDISIYNSDSSLEPNEKHTESHKLSNIRKIHFLLT